MKRTIPYGVALGNVLLFAAYYSLTKGALARVDCVMFACGQLLLLTPVALGLLIAHRHRLTRSVLVRGSLLGGCYAFVLLSLSVAMSFSSATETAFFPCLNGIYAAIFAGLLLRQRQTRGTWITAIVALGGMILMIGSPLGASHWRGDCAALLGALAYTAYLFLVDRFIVASPDAHNGGGSAATAPSDRWPVIGVQLATMVGIAAVVALLFGNWNEVHPQLPGDLWVLACVGLTVVIELWDSPFILQRVSPVSLSYLYILEPIASGIIAFLVLHEVMPMQVYIGEAVVLGAVIAQTVLSLIPPAATATRAVVPVAPARAPTGIVSGSMPLLAIPAGVPVNSLRNGTDGAVLRISAVKSLGFAVAPLRIVPSGPPTPPTLLHTNRESWASSARYRPRGSCPHPRTYRGDTSRSRDGSRLLPPVG